MSESSPKRRKSTHPLWARILAGLLGGTLLGGIAVIQSADALGAPISIAIGVGLLVLVVWAMIKAKKVWSVFDIFHGL